MARTGGIPEIADDTVVDRHFFVFFGEPDPDTIVDTLSGCEKKGKWTPTMDGEWDEKITAIEWVSKRVDAEYH